MCNQAPCLQQIRVSLPIRGISTLQSIFLLFWTMLAVLFVPRLVFAQELVNWAWSPEKVRAAGEGFWPQFRGPNGDGQADKKATAPTQWGETINLRWKTPINGKAWSSPVVWGNTIYLTNASPDGHALSVIAIDRNDGHIVYDVPVFSNDKTQPDYHEFNSYASPTPVFDGERLFVSYGTYGTAALNPVDGSKIWERRDLPCNHYRGAGSSPILFRNLLIFHMDGYDYQYIVALNKKTGETVWKTDRNTDFGATDGDLKKAFGTPLVIQLADGELQLISPAAKALIAYEPLHGKEIWRVRYDEHSSAIRPVYDGANIIISTGFSKAKLIAVAPNGKGDLTTQNIKWEVTRAIGCKPSPILFGENVCSIEDRGVATAVRRSDGEIVWQKRLGGDFTASPIIVNNLLYCFDEGGKGYVLNAEGEILATNTLDAGCLASPVAIGRDLLVRTRNGLYCFREKQ